MPAPAQIKKQVEDANNLHAEIYKKGDEPSDTDIINDLPGAEDQVVEQPKPIEPTTEEQPVGESVEEGEPTVVDEDDYKHKYNVLQGKYNKEVPRLHTQVSELTNELNSMRNLIASLEQVNTPVDQPVSKKLLKDEEVDEYGSELIDVIKRAAREEFSPLIEKLETENQQLRTMLGGMSSSVTENARDSLYRMLNTEIPNWQEINQDTGFLQWLEGIDAYSGKPRSGLLTQAFENNDAARVIAFFTGYLNENALVEDTSTTEPAPTSEPPKVDLMSMAAPGKPRSGAAPSAQEDKRVYTQSDIARFYRDVQQGVYKNRRDEQEAIERDILAAGPEGRIR